ncbi:MAG: BRO family protein [Candidatus Delongbacteria bacterium]
MYTNSITRLKESFDLIAHTDKDSEIEFWYARDIQKILGYSEWRNFFKIIDKAKESCSNTGIEIQNHFVDVNKMVEIGSSISRPVEDIMLTRYACYLKNFCLPKI